MSSADADDKLHPGLISGIPPGCVCRSIGEDFCSSHADTQARILRADPLPKTRPEPRDYFACARSWSSTRFRSSSFCPASASLPWEVSCW
jgi:hypothetical protein